MQCACLLIEHLPAKAEVARRPDLHGRPVILTRTFGSERVVLDASPEAAEVDPGMPLAEALSTCKDAVLLEPDPAHYRRLFEGVLDSIESLGADVEEVDMGVAYVELTGLELLFGGTDRLAAALLHAVPAFLTPRVGVAANKFTAYVAAQQADPGSTHQAPQDLREFLDEAPVRLLPVPWETKVRLRSFGLDTLGLLARLPVGAMQAQFGRTGRLMWSLANGIDPRPVVPRRHEQTVEAWLSFPVPTGTVGALVIGVESLLERAFAQQEMQGRAARVCLLEGAVFRAPQWHRRLVFREPMNERRRALAVVKHSLEGKPPPGPLEDLRLVLSGLVGETGRQPSLFRSVERESSLREAMRQLHARLGKEPPVYQVREVEPWSRLPERRLALVPFAP